MEYGRQTGTRLVRVGKEPNETTNNNNDFYFLRKKT